MIDGLGKKVELKPLPHRAHRCGVWVLADLPFGPMANRRNGRGDLKDLDNFAGLTSAACRTQAEPANSLAGAPAAA